MERYDVIVIGAGMAGLTTARQLSRRGWRVVVLDKGRGVGGRVATRRMGEATFDHGAQFFTVRSAQFAAVAMEWEQAGVMTEWCRGFGGVNSHIRYRGVPAMTSLAKNLAIGLDVRLEQKVTSVTEGWQVRTESGLVVEADRLVLTPPVPQGLAILDAGPVAVSQEARSVLGEISYERCLVVMVVLDGPSRIPLPGGLVFADGPVAWMADNALKGISSVPSVTIHASADYSVANWERDRMEVGRELLDSMGDWLGSSVTEYAVHGWKYSRAITPYPGRCFVMREPGLMVWAGDGFGEPRIEGAVLSGLAAADAIGIKR